jgi:spermidine synthase
MKRNPTRRSQDVCVFKSTSFGTVLLLDGVIQCTDRDEFSYQEMIAHLPLCGLEAPPRTVLVVGGGDGGVLREVTRHACVEAVHLAEIDAMVVDLAKQHFPAMAAGFDDPRVAVHITDGIKFVTDTPPGTYDAIIVDSSDPVGPAEVLFQRPFFEAMHAALKPGGVVCTQAESLWLHLPIITALADMCASVFAGGVVRYGYTTIPTYPSGQIGFMVCAKAKDGGGLPRDPSTPARPPPGPDAPGGTPGRGPLRYYSTALHSAAFTLPAFAVDALGGVGGGGGK